VRDFAPIGSLGAFLWDLMPEARVSSSAQKKLKNKF